MRRLVAIIGEAALSADDRRVLDFAHHFDVKFISQGMEDRSMTEKLDLAWNLLSVTPSELLKRIPKEYLERYHK